jgi:hypothetical protein
MDQFDQQIELATQRAEARQAREPRAIAAHYDAGRDALIVSLSTGVEISVPRLRIQGLAQAAPADLTGIEISPSGHGLHFPKVDVDLLVPGLLEGVFGSRAWMAAQLGAQGGRSTSEAKAQAARINGERGGRPAKRLATKKPAVKTKAKKWKLAAKMAAPLRSKATAAKRKPAKRRA